MPSIIRVAAPPPVRSIVTQTRPIATMTTTPRTSTQTQPLGRATSNRLGVRQTIYSTQGPPPRAAGSPFAILPRGSTPDTSTTRILNPSVPSGRRQSLSTPPFRGTGSNQETPDFRGGFGPPFWESGAAIGRDTDRTARVESRRPQVPPFDTQPPRQRADVQGSDYGTRDWRTTNYQSPLSQGSRPPGGSGPRRLSHVRGFSSFRGDDRSQQAGDVRDSTYGTFWQYEDQAQYRDQRDARQHRRYDGRR